MAGAQVLARSALAGTTPVVAASVTDGVSFTPEVFLNAAERLSCARRFVSLVPTQVHKLLEAAETNPALGSEIYDALGQFTGILLGGAPASASLLAAARELGLNVVTTYGSAETAGGCVYSGTALPGVRLRVIPEDAGLLDSSVAGDASAGEPLTSGVSGLVVSTLPAGTWAIARAPHRISSLMPTGAGGIAPTITARSRPLPRMRQRTRGPRC